MRQRILVVVQKAEHNYAAYAPEVPGCVATGKTQSEALRNMQDALRIHLEGMVEDGEELPESADPADQAQFIEVDVAKPATALHQAS